MKVTFSNTPGKQIIMNRANGQNMVVLDNLAGKIIEITDIGRQGPPGPGGEFGEIDGGTFN